MERERTDRRRRDGGQETDGLNVEGHYRKIMDLSTADNYFLYAELTNQYNFHAVIPRVPSLQVMRYHM